MKHSMTHKLILYFSAALLAFALIVGILFNLLFTNHTMIIHKEELEARAASIADTLSVLTSGNLVGSGMGNGNGYGYGHNSDHGSPEENDIRGNGTGLGAYLKFIDDIAMGDVWLVDEEAQTIQMGHNGYSSLSYDELPASAETLIHKVFTGNVESSQEFSELLGVPSITVGAPIRDENGKVTAALLLHSPISGLRKAEQDGFLILAICMTLALISAAALSVVLASHFIGPLRRMQTATERLAAGDYAARTGVKQNDEIGSLAENIDQLSLRLAEAQEESSKLEKLRRDFISNISHELRTPITVLKGSLEVLTEGLVTDPTEVQNYFKQMSADITHLQRLVNDLLELSRLQNTDFQIEKSGMNPLDALEESARSMLRTADANSVKIIVIKKLEAFLFLGDYGRLRQMFLIVLDNAVKFSPPNSTVTVTATLECDKCRIAIRDEGSGIRSEDLPHLFDRFYHERSEQNRTGTGLGLSIAREIASRHSIEIQCESTLGAGTEFSFLIPVDPNSGIHVL